MATRKISKIILGFISIVAVVILIPNVQAQQPIDTTFCFNGTITSFVASQELTIYGIESKGIQIDNLASKVFDNMTCQTMGVVKIDKGKATGTLYGKQMDPSGDFIIVEVSQVGMEYDWKYIYGTGKWKGISGGGKTFPITKGKPIAPGTFQGCNKGTGTYEIKK